MDDLTHEVLNAAFEVSNTLGSGFLEKVYERALVRELTLRGLRAVPQIDYEVTYKGETIAHYQPDILVEDEVLVELKCVDQFAPEHIAQCLNYLRVTGKTRCLLINFDKPKLAWKRIVLNYPRESAFISG